MNRSGMTARMCHRQRISYVVALAVLLPSLVLSPVQAGIWLLHRPCDQSAHYHQLPGANLGDWRNGGSTDSLCDGQGHRHAPEHEALEVDDSGEQCARELAVVISKEHLTRSERSDGNQTIDLLSPSVHSHSLSSEAVTPQLLPDTWRQSPSVSNAIAALLLCNHALLL